MNPVLGVSVYPDIDSLEDIAKYLQLASKYGFTRVFSSMFSVEGTKEEVLAYFRDFIRIAHECGMEVSLDVNPDCFKRMGATVDDLSVFHEIGCDIVRMDLSFGLEGDAKLLLNPYDIKIEFNASMISVEYAQNLLDKGVDKERLLFCHNFYPLPYSGFQWHKFLDINQNLSSTGCRIGAFVSSHAENTHGVWDAVYGLPTVERLRDLPIDLQVRIMLATDNVTDIFIGNAFASEEEFKAIQEAVKKKDGQKDNPFAKILSAMGKSFDDIAQKKIKVVPDENITDLEKDDLFHFFPHVDIGDSSEWIWRSRGPRMFYKDKVFTPRPCKKEYFEAGDILVMNDSYKHYAGEIHIALMPVKNDGLRNLIGHISEEEQMILECVRDGDIIIFEEGE
ncbi:MAG: DUF871 domain-containing protein [Solobacterium sp.]|nr:DUF871 domain-containing protein [Solobacterium sp.]